MLQQLTDLPTTGREIAGVCTAGFELGERVVHVLDSSVEDIEWAVVSD